MPPTKKKSKKFLVPLPDDVEVTLAQFEQSNPYGASSSSSSRSPSSSRKKSKKKAKHTASVKKDKISMKKSVKKSVKKTKSSDKRHNDDIITAESSRQSTIKMMKDLSTKKSKSKSKKKQSVATPTVRQARTIRSRLGLKSGSTMNDIIHEAFNLQRIALLQAHRDEIKEKVYNVTQTGRENWRLAVHHKSMFQARIEGGGLHDNRVFTYDNMRIRVGRDKDHVLMFHPKSADNLSSAWVVTYETFPDQVLVSFDTRAEMVAACSVLFDTMYWLLPADADPDSQARFTWVPTIEDALRPFDDTIDPTDAPHAEVVSHHHKYLPIDPKLGIIGRFMRSMGKFDAHLHTAVADFSGLSMHNSNNSDDEDDNNNINNNSNGK